MSQEQVRSSKPWKSEVGPERFNASEVPPAVKEKAQARLVPGASFYVAREGGSYKGPVLYADNNFIVQGVSKDKDSAVVHKRSDIELVGDKIKWREENQRLGSTPVQTHYVKSENGKSVPSETGRMYEWNAEREQANKALAKAQQFAKGIADPKEREAFLKNTEAMVRKTVGPDKDGPAQSKDKAAAEPAKAKAGKSAAAKDATTQEPKAAKPKAAKKTADKSGPER